MNRLPNYLMLLVAVFAVVSLVVRIGRDDLLCAAMFISAVVCFCSAVIVMAIQEARG